MFGVDNNENIVQLNKTNFKLYRYVPIYDIQQMLYTQNSDEIKAILLSKKQFGFDSILNQYLYHNEPKRFNDPFDCKFGICEDLALKKGIKTLINQQRIDELEKLFNTDMSNTDFNTGISMLNTSSIPSSLKDLIISICNKYKDKNQPMSIEENLELQKEFITMLLTNPDFYSIIMNDEIRNEGNINQLLSFADMNMPTILNNLNKLDEFKVSEFSINHIIQFAKLMNQEQEVIVSSQLLSDKVNALNDFIFENLNNKFRVVSLTENFNDILMWAHYANSHKGIMIEYDYFDFINNRETILLPVRYKENRVTLNEDVIEKLIKEDEKLSDKVVNIFIEGLTTKNSKWSIESEWRSIICSDKLSVEKRKIHSPPISAIYLGNGIPQIVQESIIKILRSSKICNDIPIFYMKNDINDYRLEAVLINTAKG